MKTKAKVKIIIDMFMTIALMFLMGYQFWGDAPHEWIGATMFVLFILHHILNIGWYRNLLKGKYPFVRILQIVLNMLIFLTMLMLMYSGITMSKHVFTFLPAGGGMMLARRLHILGSFWGFILMSMHMGFHWNMVIALCKKKNLLVGIKGVALKAVSCLIALYGLYAFLKRDFITYLFLRSEFVFMDYNEPIPLFYIDYITIMALFILIAYSLFKFSKKQS